jgi:hypothetical protein
VCVSNRINFYLENADRTSVSIAMFVVDVGTAD